MVTIEPDGYQHSCYCEFKERGRKEGRGREEGGKREGGRREKEEVGKGTGERMRRRMEEKQRDRISNG